MLQLEGQAGKDPAVYSLVGRFQSIEGGGWRLGGGTCIRGERRVSKMQEFVCMRTVSILGQAVNKFKSDTEKLKD